MMIDLQVCYIMLFLVSLITSFAFMFVKTRARHRLPPGPVGLPVIGNLHRLSPLPHQDFHKLSGRHGPLMHLYLGSVSCAVASSPEIISELLKTNEASFLNHPRPSVLGRLFYEPPADFVFAEAGPYWKFMKRLAASRLLGGRALEGLATVRREERVRLLRSALLRARGEEAFDVAGGLARMVSDTVARMVVGEEIAAAELQEVVKETTELVGRFNLSDFVRVLGRVDAQGLWRRSDRVHERLDRMMERILSQRRAARDGGEKAGGFLDVLLDVLEDEEEGPECRLTRDNVKSFTIEMLIGATDSTSVAIEWALSELINNQQVMAKAREEIDCVVGKTRLVEESDIENLPYIQALVKESLRLHPAVPLILRESSKRVAARGYEIPEKTRLFVNLWGMGRDPSLWDDPLEFRPERFLGEQGGEKTWFLDLIVGQNFKLLPFGIGKRACPGALFAVQVVPATVAAMIQCFKWKVDNALVSMEEGPGITLPRAHPLVCVPVPRLLNLDQIIVDNVVV